MPDYSCRLDEAARAFYEVYKATASVLHTYMPTQGLEEHANNAYAAYAALKKYTHSGTTLPTYMYGRGRDLRDISHMLKSAGERFTTRPDLAAGDLEVGVAILSRIIWAGRMREEVLGGKINEDIEKTC